MDGNAGNVANLISVTSGTIGAEHELRHHDSSVAPLRTREFKIIAFLVNYIGKRGFVPCMKEIQACCDYPNRTLIARSLKKLKAHGLIQIEGQAIRTIRLSERAVVMVGSNQNGEKP